MSQEIITPSTLTWDHIKTWDGATMRRFMADPSMRDAVKEIVSTRAYSEVQELAVRQEQSEQAPVTPPAAEVLVAPVVETPVVETPATPVVETPANKKIVVEYQVRDEKGNPIGRLTHLEANTQEELIEKMKEAHTQATRAFHRLKLQKVQSFQDLNKQETPAAPAVVMSDAEVVAALRDLRSEDPNTQLAAHKRLNDAEEAKRKAAQDAANREQEEKNRAAEVSRQFLESHKHDYNNCQSNALLLKEYFQEHNLPWTLANLEVAIIALEDRLAPVAEPTVELPPANPAPVVPPAATPTAAPVVQPTPTVPVTPAPPANPAPAQPRPGVNGGLVPGQNSAPRPAAKPQGLTIQEILSWDGKTMREKMRSPLRDEIVRVTNEAKLRSGR